MKYRNKLLVTLILIISLTFALITVSFSWIARRYSPKVVLENYKIQSSSALWIYYTQDQSKTQNAYVNDIIRIPDDFVFKQISSTDGVNFRQIVSPGDDPSAITDIVFASGENATTYGYLEFSFTIAATDLQSTQTRKVYFYQNQSNETVYEVDSTVTSSNFSLKIQNGLYIRTGAGTESQPYEYEKLEYGSVFSDSETYYQADYSTGFSRDDETARGTEFDKAFRCSITFTNDNGETETIIFSNAYESTYTALSEQAVEDAAQVVVDSDFVLHWYDSNGVELADNSSEVNSYVVQQVGESFSSRNSDSNPLFTLSSDSNTKEISVRIWLEGQDSRCINDIASHALDFVLRFDSTLTNSGS